MKFIFDTDWYECLKEQPRDVRMEVYEGMVEYATSGIVPELRPMAKLAFNFIKKQMDYHMERYLEKMEHIKTTSQKRSEAGKKGGAPIGNCNALKIKDKTSKNKQKQAKQPYINDNVNVNVLHSVCNIGRTDFSEKIKEIGKGLPKGEYKDFLRWLLKRTPGVASMLEPLTAEEYRELSELYPSSTIQSALLAMENKPGKLEDCRSTYLTLLNWCSHESRN